MKKCSMLIATTLDNWHETFCVFFKLQSYHAHTRAIAITLWPIPEILIMQMRWRRGRKTDKVLITGATNQPCEPIILKLKFELAEKLKHQMQLTYNFIMLQCGSFGRVITLPKNSNSTNQQELVKIEFCVRIELKLIQQISFTVETIQPNNKSQSKIPSTTSVVFVIQTSGPRRFIQCWQNICRHAYTILVLESFRRRNGDLSRARWKAHKFESETFTKKKWKNMLEMAAHAHKPLTQAQAHAATRAAVCGALHSISLIVFRDFSIES